MSPSSTAAQIFCVFFALFGIPLNVVVLNRVGKYMLASVRKLADFLEEKSGHRVSPSQILTLEQGVFFTADLISWPKPLHSPRGSVVSPSTWRPLSQASCSSSWCRWLCSSSRKAGPTLKLYTTASSPSAPLALGTL